MSMGSPMAKAVKLSAVLSFLGAIATAFLYRFLRFGLFLTLAITFGTTAYHLVVRLLAGAVFGSPALFHPDYTKGWYRVRPSEMKLYKFLNVKVWKDKMPTYSPDAFSPKLHTWEEIAGAMCRSELVHLSGGLLGFAPLIASVWFGAFWVFLATSICGAAFDLAFVIIQRYNRARIVKLASRRRVRFH